MNQNSTLETSLLQDLNGIFAEKSLLTVEDLMKFLDCDSRTIYNWSMRKSPPPRFQIGRSCKFPKKELAAWMAKELFRGEKQ